MKRKKSTEIGPRLATLVLFTLVTMVSLSIYSVPYAVGALPGGSLDPATIPKYVDPMPVPGVMQKAANPAGFTGDYY